ncbi:phosphatidylinositol kinase-related protein kinase tor1 [Thecaphora frezii]
MGNIVNPYLTYRNLLSTVVKILKNKQLLEKQGNKGSNKALKGSGTDLFELALAITTSTDDYFQNVAINTLVTILKDPSLSMHHHAMIEAIMFMFKTQGLKCVTFLLQIIPAFLNVICTCSTGLSEFYYQQLDILISIIKQQVWSYLKDIFGLVQENWNPISSIQLTIMSLVKAIAKVLKGEFKLYLPVLLPNMLQTLNSEITLKCQLTLLQILHTFYVFGSNIEEYLHLVLPIIVKMFERPDASATLRKAAIVMAGNHLCKVGPGFEGNRPRKSERLIRAE